MDQRLFAHLPSHIRQQIIDQETKEKSWTARYGEVRHTISLDFQGRKVVAVGNRLHFSEKWKTFHDFLFDYLDELLEFRMGQLRTEKGLYGKTPHNTVVKICAIFREEISQKREKSILRFARALLVRTYLWLMIYMSCGTIHFYKIV